MEEGGTYLADQYAATPTSSLSGDDDDNRDMDSFLDNQRDVSQSSLAGDDSGAEFPEGEENSETGRHFQEDFEFSDSISEQLREILSKPPLTHSPDVMSKNGTGHPRRYSEVSSSQSSRKQGNLNKKSDVGSESSSSKSLHSRKHPLNGTTDNHNGLPDHVMPANSERRLHRNTDMKLPLSHRSSIGAQSDTSPTGRGSRYLPQSTSFGSTTSEPPSGSQWFSSGQQRKTMSRRRSPSLPLSRAVSVEAGLAAMGSQQEKSPVSHYESVPLYSHRQGSEPMLWDKEKEEFESQLELSRDTIASLQAENKIIKSKFAKLPGVVQQLKDQLSKSHSELDYEKQQHALEVSQLQRKLRLDQEHHQKESEQTLREVLRERDSLKSEMTALQKSVDASKKSSNQSRLSVEDTLRDQRKSTQAEITALKDELGTVKNILEESENSRLSEQRKHQGTSQELAKLQKLAVRLKQQLEDAQRWKVIEYKGERVEVGELQARLAHSEKQLADLHDHRATDIAATEARLREENIKLRVDLGEAIETTEKQKERLQALIREKEDKINKLTIDLTLAHDGPKPSGDKGKKQMQYYGRWTAHRAESRKHAEEMKIITAALEKEGYGPNQATVDEVIRYLWWKKERNDVELTETKETLAALGGEEPQQAFKAWKEENEKLTSQINELKDELDTITRNSRITEETLRKEVEELGLDNQHVREDLHAAQGQTTLAQEETQVARKELKDVRKKITQQAAEIGALKGLQETSRTELEQVFAAVQQEKRHSVVLRSEAVSLRSQIDSLREQLKQLLVSENDFKEELENAASTKEQLQKQVRNLEAQISALQADSEVAEQHSESQRIKCSDIGEQLDEICAKLAMNEAQLTREQDEKQQLRKNIKEVEKDLAERMRDLEHSTLIQNELQEEVNDLTAELQEAHIAISMIEKENLKLKSQVESSADTIQLTSTDKENLAANLASSQTDLEETKRHVATLKQQLQAKDRAIEQMQMTIGAGGKHKDELMRILEQSKSNLELSQRKTDDVQAEERLIQAHLATKEQELRSAEELIESLKTEMASVRGELHDTKDRKDGTEKEMVAVKGTVKQQSEQIEQLKKQVETTAIELKAAHGKLSTERKTVTELRAECSKHEAQIEGLSQEVAKESQRAGQLFSDFKLVQEQLSKEGEQAGSRMRVLEGDKGKLQGEIKALTSSLESLRAEREELQTSLSKEKEERMQDRADTQAEIKELKLQLQESKHDMSGQLTSKEGHIQSLTAEVGTVRDQMLREKQAEQRELRRVLERVQSEAFKQQAKHEEQLMQANQAERQAVERERLLRGELETSEAQKAALQSQIETLRAKNRGDHDNIKALERQLQELRDELGQAGDKNTRQMMEFTKLRESHDEEIRQLMEQRTQTVGELSASHEVSQYLTKENDTLQAQVQQLKSQLAEEIQRVEKVKELYREEVRNVIEKMERSTHCLSEAQQESKRVQQSYEKKLSDGEARVTSLEAALGQQALEKRMVETENVCLKSRLERSSQDLEAALKAQGNYEKTIQLEKENWRKEHETTRDELQCQKEKLVALMAQLTEANSNIQALEEDNEAFRNSLECERQAVADAQHQRNQLLDENGVACRQVQLLSEEKASMTAEIAQCKEIMQEERAQSAALRQHLQEAITQVQGKHEVSLQAQSKFNSLLGSLQAEFECDRKSLETERDGLRQKLSSEIAILESLQKQVRQAESELARSNDELHESTRKASETAELLDKEISLRTEFQQQAGDLSSQLTKCKLEMNALSESVSKTKAANHELQLKLDHAERQCHSLTDQLNEEKAAAALGQTAIGEKHLQLTTRLEEELTEVNCQLAQARAQLSLAKEELVSTSQARQDLSNAVDEMNEVVEQLRGDLRNEMSQRKLAQQQSDHFEKALSEKKNEKAVQVDEIQKLQRAVADTQAACNAYQKRLEKTRQEKENLDDLLKAQQSRSDLLKHKLDRAENELRDVHKQLNEQALQYSSSTKQISRELAAVRDQHIGDCKQMMGQVESMSQQLSKLRHETVSVEAEKSLLETDCQQLREEKVLLRAQLEKSRENLRDVTDAKEKLELKNEELLGQVSHMKDELAALQKSEEDMIEYQRSLESSTRADMHRLVAEISQQLDQQYSARESFHKLKAENEMWALHSAKQKIDELLMEKKQLHLQCEREQKQCEAMKAELSSVYSQKLQEDRTRKKLESRLERVNDALNRSKAVVAMGTSPSHFGRSSPAIDRPH